MLCARCGGWACAPNCTPDKHIDWNAGDGLGFPVSWAKDIEKFRDLKRALEADDSGTAPSHKRRRRIPHADVELAMPVGEADDAQNYSEFDIEAGAEAEAEDGEPAGGDGEEEPAQDLPEVRQFKVWVASTDNTKTCAEEGGAEPPMGSDVEELAKFNTHALQCFFGNSGFASGV